MPEKLLQRAIEMAKESEVDLDNSQITELAIGIAIEEIAGSIRELAEALKNLP